MIDNSFWRFAHSIIALAFVPVSFLRLAWSGLKLEAPEFPNKEELFHYYEDTWLNGQFPILMWNVFGVTGPRTNNHVEGW